MYQPHFNQQQQGDQQQQTPKLSTFPPLRFASPVAPPNLPNLPPPPPGFLYVPTAAHQMPAAQSFIQGGLQSTLQLPVQQPLQQRYIQSANGSQIQTISSTSPASGQAVNQPGLAGFGVNTPVFGTPQPTTPQMSASLSQDAVTSMKNQEQEAAPSPDGPCYYQLSLSERDFYSPVIQQFLKNPASQSQSKSPSPSAQTQATTGTPVTPATPLSVPKMTVGKDTKTSRKQLDMEPFVPATVTVKKEKDLSDDDLITLDDDETGASAPLDYTVKPPRKLTPEEANGRTLTDGLDFHFI